MHTLRYVTHKGVEINLLKEGIRTRKLDDLFQSFYDAVEKNGRISRFKTKMHSYTLQVDFLNWKGVSWKTKYDALVDAIDSDVRALQPGTLYFDGYRLKCYMHTTKPEAVNFKSIYMQCKLTIVTDQRAWYREEQHSYKLSASDETGTTKRYAFRYPYRYQAKKGVIDFYNTLPHDARFKLIVWGPATNPAVQIGSVNRQVFISLEKGEYLTVDSMSRTITKTGGAETANVFNYRNKDSDIFADIPAGKSSLVWDGSFNFDLVLYEERSQPRWKS